MTSAPPGFRACARSIGACVLAATLHACLAVSILAQQDDGITLHVHRVPLGEAAPRLQFVALAHAFLTHSAVELNLPTTGVCKLDAVCRTTNGEQLLVLHHGTFYLCSLKTKELTRFAAPEALVRADVELYAVSPR